PEPGHYRGRNLRYHRYRTRHRPAARRHADHTPPGWHRPAGGHAATHRYRNRSRLLSARWHTSLRSARIARRLTPRLKRYTRLIIRFTFYASYVCYFAVPFIP